jgi:hypothetical protein
MEQRDRLYSTETDLRNFLSSNIWRDLSNEMDAWMQDIRAQLEVTQEIDILRRLQGNVEAVHRFLDLPQTLLDIIIASRGM